jgi:hypothetical protein
MSKNLSELTVYDLMGEDYNVWIKKNEKFGYDLEIESDNPNERIKIEGIHNMAMESFSDFCKRFLRFYDEAQGIE